MLLEDLQGKTVRELQEIAGNLLAECQGHRFDVHRRDAEILKLKAKVAQLQSGQPEIKEHWPIYFYFTPEGMVKPVRSWEFENLTNQKVVIRIVMAFELDDAFCGEGFRAVKVGHENVCEWAYLPDAVSIEDAVLTDISLMEHGYHKDDDAIKLAWEAAYLHSVFGYGKEVTGIE